jgi:hypothetical protein
MYVYHLLDVDGMDCICPVVVVPCCQPCSKAVKAWIHERQAKRAVVVGGGFIGLEMVENLVHAGLQVTLVEMLDQVGVGRGEGSSCCTAAGVAGGVWCERGVRGLGHACTQ